MEQQQSGKNISPRYNPDFENSVHRVCENALIYVEISVEDAILFNGHIKLAVFRKMFYVDEERYNEILVRSSNLGVIVDFDIHDVINGFKYIYNMTNIPPEDENDETKKYKVPSLLFLQIVDYYDNVNDEFDDDNLAIHETSKREIARKITMEIIRTEYSGKNILVLHELFNKIGFIAGLQLIKEILSFKIENFLDKLQELEDDLFGGRISMAEKNQKTEEYKLFHLNDTGLDLNLEFVKTNPELYYFIPSNLFFHWLLVVDSLFKKRKFYPVLEEIENEIISLEPISESESDNDNDDDNDSNIDDGDDDDDGNDVIVNIINGGDINSYINNYINENLGGDVDSYINSFINNRINENLGGDTHSDGHSD